MRDFISIFDSEREQARAERTTWRLWVASLVLLGVFLGSNGYHLINYWMRMK